MCGCELDTWPGRQLLLHVRRITYPLPATTTCTSLMGAGWGPSPHPCLPIDQGGGWGGGAPSPPHPHTHTHHRACVTPSCNCTPLIKVFLLPPTKQKYACIHTSMSYYQGFLFTYTLAGPVPCMCALWPAVTGVNGPGDSLNYAVIN